MRAFSNRLFVNLLFSKLASICTSRSDTILFRQLLYFSTPCVFRFFKLILPYLLQLSPIYRFIFSSFDPNYTRILVTICVWGIRGVRGWTTWRFGFWRRRGRRGFLILGRLLTAAFWWRKASIWRATLVCFGDRKWNLLETTQSGQSSKETICCDIVPMGNYWSILLNQLWSDW